MKRRYPWWLLAAAFLLVPLAEIYVIVQIGQTIGAWWTIALLILASIVGSWLIKREGSAAWRALTEALRAGRMPARELADGALIVIGGTLMVTPGFLSDIVGLLVVLPFTRPLARGILTGVIAKRMTRAGGTPGFGPAGFGGATFGGPAGFGPMPGQAPNARRPGPDVVQGDVVDPEGR